MLCVPVCVSEIACLPLCITQAGEKARAAREAVRTTFEGAISDAFEGSLHMYVAEEEKELFAFLEVRLHTHTHTYTRTHTTQPLHT